MQETIYLPETINEMRINHLPFVLALRDLNAEKPTELELVNLVALFTGLPEAQIKRYKPEDVKYIYLLILSCFASYQPAAVPLSLTFEDQVYTLRNDFKDASIEWIIDLKNADIVGDPILCASLIYIEDGKAYGESGEDMICTNPLNKRSDIFRKHLPLATFIDIQGFFLLSWKALQLYSIEMFQNNDLLKK